MSTSAGLRFGNLSSRSTATSEHVKLALQSQTVGSKLAAGRTQTRAAIARRLSPVVPLAMAPAPARRCTVVNGGTALFLARLKLLRSLFLPAGSFEYGRRPDMAIQSAVETALVATWPGGADDRAVIQRRGDATCTPPPPQPE